MSFPNCNPRTVTAGPILSRAPKNILNFVLIDIVIVDMRFTCSRIDLETDADRHRVIIDLYWPSV